MRRTFVGALATAMVIATSAAAQKQEGAEMRNPPSSNIMWGPFGGLNYTTLYGSDATGASSRTDFALGGQVDFNFAPNAVFRSGLVYSRRGASIDDNGQTVTFKINYLEVPLLLGYRFATTGGARPYLMGGGQLGFKVGCTFEGSNGGVTASVSCDDPNLGANFSSTDFAVVGAGGIAVPVGINSFTVDLRYALGLQKVEKSSEVKNRGFTLGVGFLMPFGR